MHVGERVSVLARAMRSGPRALLGVALVAVALSACDSTGIAAGSTTVVPPPPGCDTSRVIVIGASLDLTGSGAALGHAYLAGLELGVAKANGAGGVPPHHSCFELMYKDNRGSPAVDDQAILDLANTEKAGVVVSSFLGSAHAHYLGQLGIPEISLSDLSANFEPKRFPNTYPMTASMESQAFVIGKALKARKVTSVGLVVTDDAASDEGAAHLAALSSVDGFTITSRARVSPSGVGASAALSELRVGHPEVLVVLDDTGAVAAVLLARRGLGWSVPVIAGPSASEAGVLSRESGATRGVLVAVPAGAVAGGATPSSSISFRRLLLAHLDTSSLEGSIIPYAETYDAVTMIANAANGAMGTTASDVTTYLENANYQGVLAAYTYTAAAHTGIAAADQTVVSLDSLSNGLFTSSPADDAG
jgi:branched-chain amino acid transport system substrate-binding protein